MRYIKLDIVGEEMLSSAVAHHPKPYVRLKSQILLSSHRGLSVPSLSLAHGVGYRHIYRLFSAYESRGLLGLYIKPGRGAKSSLDWSSEEVENSLSKHIEAHPQNLGKVASILSLESGKKISKRMVQRNLKKRYNWKRMRKWLKPLQDPIDYKEKLASLIQLTILAQSGFIDMYFADESYFNLSPEVPYGWQKIGEHIKIVPQRKKSEMILGFLSREKQELQTYKADKNINSDFVIECVDNFAKTISKKTVIVLDNASTHCSKKFQAKIAKWEQQDIEIFYLPKYSPHLNLIETCWRKMKYEWLEPVDYDSQQTLAKAIQNIFDNYGKEFNINFSEFTNIELLLNCG